MLMSDVDSPPRMVMEEELRKCVICVVCGQQAHGMYFGAIVCLPCKSFFIRCTKEGQPRFNCQGSRSCNIQGGNRMRCQYCRYKRCIDAGMARKEKPEKIEPAEGQELCRVCSDIANGIHFGVMTCEGCKKFFRRALKECNSYVCKYRQTCQLNPRNRNACRYCRYQKCLHLGMSRKAIRMGRPRKSKSSGGKLQSITSLFRRSVSQYSTGYGGSDSGSSDSGQQEDFTFLSKEQHHQHDFGAMKYPGSITHTNGHHHQPIEMGSVKEEPVDRFSCPTPCSQWNAPREPWPLITEPKMKPQSSPPQAATAVRKMEFEQPHPCSFTGLLAEASMPPSSTPQISNSGPMNPYNSSLGDFPLSYDSDELNEILAMLPNDGTIDSRFLHQIQNELRLLVRESNYELPHPSPVFTNSPCNKVILNTPTIAPREHLQADMMATESAAESFSSMTTPVGQMQSSGSVCPAPGRGAHCSPLSALLQGVEATSTMDTLTQEHCSPPPMVQNTCPTTMSSPKPPSTPLTTHCSPISIGLPQSSPEPGISHTTFPSPQTSQANLSPMGKDLLDVQGSSEGINQTMGDKVSISADPPASLQEKKQVNLDWSKYPTSYQRTSGSNWQIPESTESNGLTKSLENDYGKFPSLFVNHELPVK